MSSELGNFFLAKKGLGGTWDLLTQTEAISADDIFILDVVGQDTISYNPYKYITVSATVGDLLNSKIISAFNRGVDSDTAVLRSSLLKEGV